MASIRSAGRKSQVKRKHPLKEFSFMMCCKSCTTEKAWKQTNKPHEEKDLTLRLQVQRLLGHMMTSIKMSKDQSWTSHCTDKCFIKATRKTFCNCKNTILATCPNRNHIMSCLHNLCHCVRIKALHPLCGGFQRGGLVAPFSFSEITQKYLLEDFYIFTILLLCLDKASQCFWIVNIEFWFHYILRKQNIQYKRHKRLK